VVLFLQAVKKRKKERVDCNNKISCLSGAAKWARELGRTTLLHLSSITLSPEIDHSHPCSVGVDQRDKRARHREGILLLRGPGHFRRPCLSAVQKSLAPDWPAQRVSVERLCVTRMTSSFVRPRRETAIKRRNIYVLVCSCYCVCQLIQNGILVVPLEKQINFWESAFLLSTYCQCYLNWQTLGTTFHRFAMQIILSGNQS